MENCGEDGDTIQLKDVDAVISLKELYNKELDIEGTYIDQQKKIEELENQVTILKQQLEAVNKSGAMITLSTGGYSMGIDEAIRKTDLDLLVLDNVEQYKKCKVEFSGHMGNYISARIYLDGNLIQTISDSNEHEIELNNNKKIVINAYSYGLNNGVIIIKKLELE